jgi:hypothetical protein
MKRFKNVAVTLTLAGAMVGAGAVTTASVAQAAGCASLTRSWTEGNNNYATVKNVCSTTRSMRPTVPFMADPPCRNIAPGKSSTWQTSGALWYLADGAAVC